MFKRIIVPLDGSRLGSAALKYAEAVAERFTADLVLMQAVVPATPTPIPATPAGAMSPATAELALQAARAEDKRNAEKARRYLQRKVREVKGRGLRCSYKLVMGHPGKSIINLCRKERIDLAVMSTHGRGGLKRAILGSVADEVVRESKVPVLVIRPGK